MISVLRYWTSTRKMTSPRIAKKEWGGRPPDWCLSDIDCLMFIMWYLCYHDDVIKWKHFPRYWPFVRGIHRSPVNSPHKGQCHGALIFTLICTRINGWVNNCKAGDLRRNRAHYDAIVMVTWLMWHCGCRRVVSWCFNIQPRCIFL